MQNSHASNRSFGDFFEKKWLPNLIEGQNCAEALGRDIAQALCDLPNPRKQQRRLFQILEDIQDRMIIAKYQFLNNELEPPAALEQHQHFIKQLQSVVWARLSPSRISA